MKFLCMAYKPTGESVQREQLAFHCVRGFLASDAVLYMRGLHMSYREMAQKTENTGLLLATAAKRIAIMREDMTSQAMFQEVCKLHSSLEHQEKQLAKDALEGAVLMGAATPRLPEQEFREEVKKAAAALHAMVMEAQPSLEVVEGLDATVKRLPIM
ncbi:hypothetical protein KFL_000810010 [Klebsormidium nitens]|uniref:Uncharacterized protein n=1 Tax=Klebsormidium nitens TaxID=105231 RepID=A0A1Y1HS54_KLENI|nr:hypothetical protein KFL_000810010 [Klebsormidium nitens]|eukprot:GAQ81460.1 hypothetical protein KFL_000810010 [Klebsormidium nitens]